jgi:hypothetical protein
MTRVSAHLLPSAALFRHRHSIASLLIKKISDMHLFDKGWNAVREQIFENQKKLGVIPKDAKLTPWPDDLLKRWDALTSQEKKLFIRQADVYAAYLAYHLAEGDQGQGRGPLAVPSCHRYRADNPGGGRYSRTQNRRWHQAGTNRRREHDVYVRQGKCQRAIKTPYAIFRDDGRPRPIMTAGSPAPKWTGPANLDPAGLPWELYDLNKDWTQYENVAEKNPQKLKELQNLFWTEAAKYQVLPLDASTLTRFVTPRPSITAGRTMFTWSGEITGTPRGDAPFILDASYNFKADVEIPEGGARQTMERSLPITLQWDENFDVGADTGTPVDEHDYQVPFHFTGKLDKLTLTIDRPKLSPEDEKKLMEHAHRNNRVSE